MLGVGFVLLVATSCIGEPSARERLQLEPIASVVGSGLASWRNPAFESARLAREARTPAPAGRVEVGDGLGALLARLAPIAPLAALIDLVTFVREGQPVARGEPILLRLVLPARIYVGWSF